MKARELAELLLKHPELEVCVRGYEDGVDKVEVAALTRVKRYPRDYCGEYIAEDGYSNEDCGTWSYIETKPEQVIYIGLAYDLLDENGIGSIKGTIIE